MVWGGGASRDRTDDLLLAKQALSQLSYGPRSVSLLDTLQQVVGLGGVEPPTSPLSGVRSNQLSYRPGFAHTCLRPDSREHASRMHGAPIISAAGNLCGVSRPTSDAIY